MSKISSKIAVVGGIFVAVTGVAAWSQYRQNQTLSEARTKETAASAVVDKFTDNASAKRNRARDLRAQSDERLAAKDYAGAMDARLKILDYNKPKVSNLGALTFYATQQLALQDVDKIAAHLDAPASRNFADQLEKQDAKLFTLTQVLGNQKAEELKQMDAIARKGEWNEVIDGLKFTPQEKAALRKTSVAQVKNNIAAFYDAAIANAKLTYSPTRARPAIALDAYSKNYATAYAASRFLWAKAKAQRLLIVAALRARADRLENKTASAPLPFDPFGAAPLRNKNGAIYSVGPDGVDNGATPIADFNRARPIDKGDIVAPAF